MTFDPAPSLHGHHRVIDSWSDWMVGLSTTRFVLDFQRDLATAQGHELRTIVDYNKSLPNLARQKATMLDRYQLELS
jgi:hypothetical protein